MKTRVPHRSSFREDDSNCKRLLPLRSSCTSFRLYHRLLGSYPCLGRTGTGKHRCRQIVPHAQPPLQSSPADSYRLRATGCFPVNPLTRPIPRQLLHSKQIIFFRSLPVISAVSLDLFLVGSSDRWTGGPVGCWRGFRHRSGRPSFFPASVVSGQWSVFSETAV